MIREKKDGRVIATRDDMTRLRRQVYEQARDEDDIPRCARCGTPTYWQRGEMHHKHGRGMGGGKRNDIPEEMEWLCNKCHEKETRPKAILIPKTKL